MITSAPSPPRKSVLIVLIGGGLTGALTVNERLAGLASMFPAASWARTSNAWSPLVSGPTVVGDVHAANAPASSLHWKVDPASLDENANVGVLSLVEPDGPEVIVVCGALRSPTDRS